MALYELQKDDTIQVDKLLTSVNGHHSRVSMHGLRRTLLEKQAKSIGIPLKILELPEQPSMEDYNRVMNQTVAELKSEGYTSCGFGDIFLEDLRHYREKQLEPHNISCRFPLWKKDTRSLISEFLNMGFKAITVCIKAGLLDESFVGRELDASFIRDLPKNVDPCGENGEFHTFCYDGPIFSNPIPFTIGEHVYREYKTPNAEDNKDSMGFWFCDLVPED